MHTVRAGGAAEVGGVGRLRAHPARRVRPSRQPRRASGRSASDLAQDASDYYADGSEGRRPAGGRRRRSTAERGGRGVPATPRSAARAREGADRRRRRPRARHSPGRSTAKTPPSDLCAAPGNPGTADLATNLPIPADDIDRLDRGGRCARRIDLTIIGPEVPLALGLADRLRARGTARRSGPARRRPRIEASKAFSKDVMAAAGIPTAASRTFTDLARRARLRRRARRAAGGEGLGPRRRQGRHRLRHARARRPPPCGRCWASGSFGDAGRAVVIEAFLEGEELSVLGLTERRRRSSSSRRRRITSASSRATRGPNTGGMGAYAPVSIATPALLERVRREVMLPALVELDRRGAPFTGVLYAGLMVAPDGTPNVVEFNCRFGDPETQVVLPLLARRAHRRAPPRGGGEAGRAAGRAARGLRHHRARRARLSRRPGKGRGDFHSRPCCPTG